MTTQITYTDSITRRQFRYPVDVTIRGETIDLRQHLPTSGAQDVRLSYEEFEELAAMVERIRAAQKREHYLGLTE